MPLPQEYQQILTSNSPGVAQPAPVYTWEKKIGTGSFVGLSPAITSLNYPMPELTDPLAIYRRKTMSSCPGLTTIFAYSNEVSVAVQDPSGVISGTVTSDKGAPVAGVTIKARRVQAVPGGLANKTYATVTGSDGAYTLEGLYFGPEVNGATATFEVTPTKGDHVFDFASLDKMLTNNVKTQTANFKDLTVFSVEGKVNQICTTCTDASVSNPDSMALKDVAFKVFKGDYVANAFTYVEADSIIAGAFKTGADGRYSITLNEQGYYKVIPKYKNHFFVKSDSIVNVGMGGGAETAIQYVNFSDPTTNVMSGLVKADCDQYIGRVVVQFTQQIKSGNSFVAGNFIRRDTANLNSGYYQTILPASTYTVTIADIIEIPEDANEVPLYSQSEIVNEFFGNTTFFPADSMRKDLSLADSTFNLTFHEKPQIAVIQFDGPTCSPALKLFPLVEQGRPTTIQLGVFQGSPEKPVLYQGNNVFGCPVENDTLRISSNITSGSAIKDTFLITNNGYVDFNFIPGEPTISGDYSKQFNLDFDDKYERSGGNASKSDVKPVILGSKIISDGFVTTSPEIPFLILRDPPGSQSFSFREANTVTEIATSFSTKRTNAKDVWIDVKVGAKFEAGLGVSYESAFWGNLKGGFKVESTNSSSTESINSITNSDYYSTSAAGIPGDQGDVYYGGAVNFLEASVIEIEFDETACEFKTSTNMMLAPDGFETEYAYTEYAIKTDVIPDLETLRDQSSSNANDKRKWQNQINIWQDVLDYNAQLKAEAKHQYNRSFDSGIGPLTSTVSTSATKIQYIEFEMETDSSLAAEVGMELGGSGLSEGGTISLRMARGKTSTNTTMQETVTGFTIQDGPELGDKFTLNIKSDPVYSTPVFDLIAGETSCPHEENTKRRDVPILTVDDDDITVLFGQTHSAFLTLRNESESLEARNYFLKYDPGASIGVANVNIAGAGIGPFSANIPSQGASTYETLISRFSPNQTNAFLVFKAYDACNSAGNSLDADQLFEVRIKAKFDDGISDVLLSFPENNFAVSSNSPASLSYTMSGYDLNLLTDISLEYAAVNSSTWTVAKTLLKANLAANSMTSTWQYNISNDGKYKLRLRVKNGSKTLYSDIVTGIWDRKGPLKYGSAQPSDFVYALGDEISQSFNEDLDCENFNSANFTLTRMSNNTTIPATLGCFENRIIITPNAPVTGLGDSVAVSLINIRDAYGNVAANNFDWEFRVGTPDLNPNANLADVTSTPITLSIAEAQAEKDKGADGTNSTTSVNTEMFEDASGKLTLNFALAQVDTNDVTINFFLAGTAILGSDYTLSGQHTFLGNRGVIKIVKGTTITKLYIDPIADTKQETDETILLSIVNGGDYNIGISNVIQLLIKNDDTGGDCDNNGQVYSLANNGGASILPDTYHKLILESDGDVATPTTVIFKGEKSVLLNPGFSVDNGAIFTASIEDCPNVAASSFAVNDMQIVSETNEVKTSKQPYNDVLEMTRELGKNGEVSLKFQNPIEQHLKVSLLDSYAKRLKDLSGEFVAGENEVVIQTSDLSAGTYYLSVKGGFITYMHRIVVFD